MEYYVGLKLKRVGYNTSTYRDVVGEVRTIVKIDTVRKKATLDTGFTQDFSYYDRFFELDNLIVVGGE